MADSMARCATCKWWDMEDWEMGGVVRICLRVRPFWDSTQWDATGHRTFTAEAADVLAFAQDGSDYRADLLTRAEFGCVMHEPKP